MKFLVTGANGYLGTQLVHALIKKGHIVNAFILSGTDTSHLQHHNIHIYEGDILRYADVARALQGCEAVFHLASVVSLWEKDPGIFYRINVTGTQTLLRACTYQEVKRVLVVSSAGIFGPSLHGQPVHENTEHIPHPSEPYELSKYRQMEVAKNFLDEGLEIILAYPTRIYGPGIQSHSNSISTLFKKAATGNWRVIPGYGNNYGNYVFISDVVKGLQMIMERGKNGEDYLLGGQNATYNELFELLGFLIGQRLSMLRIPPLLIRLAGRIEELRTRWTHKRPLITLHSAQKATSDWLVSIQKMRKEFGFHPIPLEEGLYRTLNGICETPPMWLEYPPKQATA